MTLKISKIFHPSNTVLKAMKVLQHFKNYVSTLVKSAKEIFFSIIIVLKSKWVPRLTVKFFVCVFHSSTITLLKVDSTRTSDKSTIFQSYILDISPWHRNIMAGKDFHLLNLFSEK